MRFPHIAIDRSWFRGARFLWLIAATLLVFGLGLVLYAFLSGGDETAPPVKIPVEAELASPYVFADIIEALGTAKARESVSLTSKVSDKVMSVNFEDGAYVKKGDILVTLNNSEELANVSAALAASTEAERAFERAKTLVQTGYLSQASLDIATRNLSTARANLEAARARAGNYVVAAPFSGILGLRQVSPGTLVSPGTKITTLDDISIIKVDFAIPEKFLSALAEGQEISTKAAAFPGRDFQGLVRTIDSRVDPVTRTVTVRAEILNSDGALRPGMLLTVNLYSSVRESLSILNKAVIPVGDNHFVYRITAANVAERVPVTVGGDSLGRVEILQGLQAGDRIAYSGLVNLQDGSPVRIVLMRKSPASPPDLVDRLKRKQSIADEARQGQ